MDKFKGLFAKKYKNLCAKVEGLYDESKPHHAGEILDVIGSSEFEAFKEHLFAPTTSEPSSVTQADYVKEIAEYTLNAISLYKDAVPHKAIFSIKLRFYQDTACEKIQPQIDIQFDSGLYPIDIGMFWNDEIGLEREGKKNCQTMAENVWFEYKEEFKIDFSSLAESIRQTVSEQFPKVKVEYKIV